MKTLLSLFDYSGIWTVPYAEAGWNVILWDKKHSTDLVTKFSNIKDACADYFYEHIFDNYGTVDGVLSGPPCTDFTVSGAQYWLIKDADGRTEESLELVRQVLRIVDLCMPEFWVIENPVGRLAKLMKLEDPYYFHPYEFAGYLEHSDEETQKLNRIRSKDGKDVTRDEALFIIEMNAYTKKTGLWGEFNRNLIKKPVDPVKGSPQGSPLQKFGGNSEKTKEFRSKTPIGFADAFFLVNH